MSENKNTARLLTLREGMDYCGMGKNVFREWTHKIGAARVFSPRMVRYDKAVIDEALDRMRLDEHIAKMEKEMSKTAS